MPERRPDPDDVLTRVQEETARACRGRLKIFFGAVAGVGKTYAMLQAGRARRAEGVDVVAGYIEAHNRPETAALLDGLELLPPKIGSPPMIGNAGGKDDAGTSRAGRREFDLEAALRRRPALILVDELAHSNPPNSRHPKRYLDVEELLGAGIDVYTTVNVQHLESISDVVTQITGAPVRETLPDRIIEQADNVTLIDLSPEDLLRRLREGKVYLPEQAQHAARNFFRLGNLMALRELALRATADRVDTDIRDYREAHAIERPWPVQERVLVCIGPGQLGERLVKAAKRTAVRLRADWIALYVETPGRLRLSLAEREDVVRILRLAEQLGAETVTLTAGRTFAEEVLELAHARNATRIIVGKPRRHGWQRWLLGSVVDAIVEGSGSIDVQVIGDEASTDRGPPTPTRRTTSRYDLGVDDETAAPKKPRWRGYLAGILITLACTATNYLMAVWFSQTNLAMVYLLGVVLAATRFGRIASVLTAVLSVAAFDFCFIPPLFSFAFADTQYLLTALVMLIVGLVISTLAASLRLQLRVATHRERRTAALYAMTRQLAVATSLAEVGDSAVTHVADVFDAHAEVLLHDKLSGMMGISALANANRLARPDASIADWTLRQGQVAGVGTDTLAGTDAMYLPLRGAHGTVGVLAVRPRHPRRLLIPEQLHLLETFASQIAVAVEREQLGGAAQASLLAAQDERLRSSLLSSISHDLRTPLAIMAGSSSSLLQGTAQLPPGEQRRLVEVVYDESQRMTRVVNNILDMTRLEASPVQLDLQWYPLEEIVGAVLGQLREPLTQHPVDIDIPPSFPMLHVDGVLFEKLLTNLLENAAKYTPAGTRITLAATRLGVGEQPAASKSIQSEIKVRPNKSNAAIAIAATVSTTATNHVARHEIAAKPVNGGEICLIVSDDGPGFPPGSENRLFDKFYRGRSEGSISGAGLGLTICRAIVEAHGGRIWAENRPTGGAQFIVALPFSVPPPAPTEGTQSTLAMPTHSVVTPPPAADGAP